MGDRIDIVVVSCNRLPCTRRAIRTIHERTFTPFRLIVVDNGSFDGSVEWLLQAHRNGLIHRLVLLKENYGVHWAKNIGLHLVRSAPYYVDTDNDIICPKLTPDWLEQLVELMDKHPDFGAIALRPHVFVGGIPGWSEEHEVVEVPWVGAVMRIMRTQLVREFGWKKVKQPGRDNEEKWVASKMHARGYRVGYARDLYAIHLFGTDSRDPWGYPVGFQHGHKEVWPPVNHFSWDRMNVDWETCKPIGT